MGAEEWPRGSFSCFKLPGADRQVCGCLTQSPPHPSHLSNSPVPPPCCWQVSACSWHTNNPALAVQDSLGNWGQRGIKTQQGSPLQSSGHWTNIWYSYEQPHSFFRRPQSFCIMEGCQTATSCVESAGIRHCPSVCPRVGVKGFFGQRYPNKSLCRQNDCSFFIAYREKMGICLNTDLKDNFSFLWMLMNSYFSFFCDGFMQEILIQTSSYCSEK